MVSLKDIATRCGVSVATVSKALNDHRDIGPETKNRIIETAKEMGYVPNAAAKSLKTAKTHNIGVLFVDEAMSGLTHDYFNHVLDSFKQAVEREGYDITFISSNKQRVGRFTYLEHARFRRFDGVCIACVDFTDPEVIELVNSEIPVVTIDHVYNDTTAVVSDNIGGMKELLTYIVKKGHEKIAYIHGADSSVTRSRLTSFYKTAEELGVNIPDAYVLGAPYRDTEGTYRRTMELLDLENRPTCILYPDDFAAFGGIRAITERGLKIPEDISIAGYDGIRISRHISPQLTTYRQDTWGLGMQAARNLIGLIERPKTTLIQQILVSGGLFEGETVADINSPDI